MRETVAGVPLGISRDYDYLPLAEPIHLVRCSSCWKDHEDGKRQLEDGVCILAFCKRCREELRAEWIRNTPVTLPRAIARFRRT